MNKINTSLVMTLLAMNTIPALANEVPLKPNLYLLDNEIKIVKLKNFMQNTITSDKDSKFIQKETKRFILMHDAMLKNGYIEEYNQAASTLLQQEKIIHYKNAMGIKANNLHLLANEIPVAYDYKPILPNLYTNHLGFSNAGVYRDKSQGYEKEGWTGIGELFVVDQFICLYSENNTQLARGGNELIEELITYKIHNKPTLELVRGNDKSGYTYEIKWYQKNFDKELKCAHKSYSKALYDSVISLANEIDSK